MGIFLTILKNWRSVAFLIVVVIAIANLFYIKSLKSDIEELKREIVVKELEASQLKSKIDLQNQKIKELEVKSSDIQKEYAEAVKKGSE